MPSAPLTFDYIVIGAGSAGCVVAARLSEISEARVLLVEAGNQVPWWRFSLHIPAAKGMALTGSAFHWGLTTQPQKHLNDRRIPWYQGKALGGSSAINGMVFVRGNPADYDAWATDPELSHWKHAGVLPYFRKLEDHSAGGNGTHGSGGPMKVRVAAGTSPLSKVFVTAGTEAGHPEVLDMNGDRPEGVGLLDMNVHRGRRVSTWEAYVRPILGRRNLTVLKRSQAVRLLIEKGRCLGLQLERDGVGTEVRANAEVIVCAGSIGSAALLLRSGIGPADELSALGIRAQLDLPGVGGNLHDHLQITVAHKCTRSVTLHALSHRHMQLFTGLRWLLTRSGWGASNHFEAGGFLRSGAGVGWPDIQLQFTPHAMRRNGDGELVGEQGYQVHAGPQRPKSRGRVRLRSADHRDAPLLDPRYLSDPSDWQGMRDALSLARELLSQPAFAPYRGAELRPGRRVRSRAEIDAYIRRSASSGYHPCGTCRMGSGPAAVVDGRLRLHGIEGLRVADGSVIPSIPSGNLNAPTIMIGEKAAAMIRGGE